MRMAQSFTSPDPKSQYEILDLNKRDSASNIGAEIYRRLIKGEAERLQAGHFQNIIESVFANSRIINCDLSNTDFKDCVVRDSLFKQCKIEVLTFATSTISDSSFTECTFSNSTFQNCSFIRTTFLRCDLSKLLVKECRFVDCLFEDCITSNKLLELCLAINTKFRGTDIQLDTILSNFGLVAGNLDRSRVRSGRTDKPHRFIELGDIRNASRDALISVPALAGVRLDYFERGELLSASAGLDCALGVDTWTQISSNLGSFLQVYKTFIDFLLILYENDHLYSYFILKLHDLSGTFVKSCQGLPFETTTTLMGIHQQLSIYVEEIFLAANDLTEINNHHLDVIVEGPTSNVAVQEIFSPLFENEHPARISRLQPQNSPWQLGLDFLAHHHCFRAAVLLLATRVRGSVRKIKSQAAMTLPKGPTKQKKQGSEEIAASFEVGFIRGTKSTTGYGLSVLIPGSRVAELQIEFDSKKLSKMAAFLVAIDFAN